MATENPAAKDRLSGTVRKNKVLSRRYASRLTISLAALVVLFTRSCANAQQTPGGVSIFDKPSIKVVYVDTLLNAPSALPTGFGPYCPMTAFVDGEQVPRSLLAEAIESNFPTSRSSPVTLALNGNYDRFAATQERDNRAQVNGPAYCFYEVWADGARIFRSDAMCSSLAVISMEGLYTRRRRPPEIDLTVSGVRRLRLVTRYPTEFSQVARDRNRACGCIWGSARLTLSPIAMETTKDPTLRAALRYAALKRLPSLPVPPAVGKKEGPTVSGTLRLAITQVRVDSSTADSPLQLGEMEGGFRSYIGEILYGIQKAGAC